MLEEKTTDECCKSSQTQCSAPPKPPWWKSKKYVATAFGWVVLQSSATSHLFSDKGDFGSWSSFSLTLFAIALGVYTSANVVQKFVIARAGR